MERHAVASDSPSSTLPSPNAKIVAVGTAAPDSAYTQRELIDILGISDRRVRSVFLNSAIGSRRLTLPPLNNDGVRTVETQGQLLGKHKSISVEIGSAAIRDCLRQIAAEPGDIQYLCCVTTTGFLTPGVSALICKQLGLDSGCGRIDVVGMGCNAGLNGLPAVSNWCQANPGKLAIMLCVEVCSAAYVLDGQMNTAVVNSLFGDGAAAVALVADSGRSGPTVLKYSSCLISDAIDAMRFDWSDEHGAFNFKLARDVPYVVGAHSEQVIESLLRGTGVRRSAISHWILHSGGKKVIDSVRVNLGLSAHDVRHTMSVLRDYGNVSSASFLFSLQRLFKEGIVKPGDHGVLMTMGPGSTIETALVRW